jgi:hypothetical protein
MTAKTIPAPSFRTIEALVPYKEQFADAGLAVTSKGTVSPGLHLEIGAQVVNTILSVVIQFLSNRFKLLISSGFRSASEANCYFASTSEEAQGLEVDES